MRLRRRTFLRLTTAGFAGAALSGGMGAAGPPFKPFVLILSDCDPTVDPETLFAMIDPIVSHNIPIGLAVDPETPGAGPEVPEAGAPAAYFDVLRALSSDLPGLVELMPDAVSLKHPIAYFLARKAFDVVGRFQARFDPAPGALPVSLFTRDARAEGVGVAGVRASGFRSVYSSGSRTAPTRLQDEASGVLTVSGGIAADIHVSAAAFGASLDRAIRGEDFILVNLSLAALKGMSPDRAFERGSELAVVMARRKGLGQIVPNLPRDFHLRLAGADYGRAISVCVDTTRAGEEAAASYAEFVARLQTLSIGVTRILRGQGGPFDDASGSGAAASAGESCRVLASALLAPDPPPPGNQAVRPKCAALLSGARQNPRTTVVPGLSTLLDLSPDAGGVSGLDDSGVMRVPAAVTIPGGPDDAPPDIAGKLPGLIGHHRDAIVVIDARSIATSSGRNLIFRELSDLAAQSWSRFRTLDGYSSAVVPDFNHLELIRQSNYDRFADARAPHEVIATERQARLLAHATLAWQYFANETHEKSGFAPATVFRAKEFKSTYETITMWDIGSHLNGVLCAAEMGIIPHAELVDRATRILDNLPTRRIAGLRLPVAEFHFASGSPLAMDYNACDTGRLLVALHLLARVPELKEKARSLVAGWDLDQTVAQGKIMDIFRQRKVDASQTNCSHYAGIGYGLWGVRTVSPYRTPPGESAFDQSIRVLNAVANIGAYGAEPHLLEAVELGFSPASKILADVLYSAQLAEYRRSGDLVAVSETSLDREPWFTYQGLDVNSVDDPWKVSSIIDEPRFRTPGFSYANHLLSTKAALLWSAVRPGAFSNRLVERAVRDTQLPGLGFALGVYRSTDQPTFGYSDMNTNGVILEALACALRGYKPMREAQLRN